LDPGGDRTAGPVRLRTGDIAGTSVLRFLYRDFDLKLFRDHYQSTWVEAIGPPGARSNPINFELPSSAEFETSLARFRAGLATREDWQLLGRTLFAALFPAQIDRLWTRAQDILSSDTILRLRLDVRDPELAALPWELVIQDEFPMVLSPRRPITRCPYSFAAKATRLDSVDRVLVVAPSPAGASALRIESEVAALGAGLPSGARVDVLRPGTLSSLRKTIAQGYDVLHFIGHGSFQDDVGHLSMEDKPIGGAEFGSLLIESSIRLAVLNSCETGISSPIDPLLGVADAVLAAGVPGVVAMQGVVSDDAGVIFARALYEGLGDRQPLDVSVQEARRVLFQERGENRADWGLPVLFAASDDQLPAGGPVVPIDPGSGRVRAHLRHIRRLGLAPRARPTAILPDPATSRFVGREDHVDTIQRLLAPDGESGPVVIRGAPGVGCSALGREVAARLFELSTADDERPEAFQGIVWMSGSHTRINLLEPDEPEEVVPHGMDEVYTTLAAALKNPELGQARPAERLLVLSTVLSEARYLLLVDNIDEMRPRDRDTLFDLAEPTRIIATSHARLDVGMEITLDGLGPRPSLDLLLHQAGPAWTGRRDVLASVGEAARGNPLALCWGAAQLEAGVMSSDEVRTVLSSAGPDTVADTCLQHSVAGLSLDELKVLGALALFPQPPSPADVAGAARLDEPTVERCLAQLARATLIARRLGVGRPRLSPRTRHQALAALRKQSGLARKMTKRSVDHIATRLQAESTVRRLDDDEVENAMWTVHQAFQLADWSTVLKLRDALHDAFYELGHLNEMVTLGTLAWDAADRLGDRKARAWCALYPLARYHFSQGDYDEAMLWCERARALFGQEGNEKGSAAAERYLGRVLQAKGHLEDAQKVFARGLQRARRLGPTESRMCGDLLASLAGLAEQRGRNLRAGGDQDAARAALEEAIKRYREALALYQESREAQDIATSYASLGRVSLAAELPEQARGYLEESRRLLQSMTWPRRMGDVLLSMALLAERDGDLTTAERMLLQSRDEYLTAAAFAELPRVDAAIASISAQLTTKDSRQVTRGSGGDTPSPYDATRQPGPIGVHQDVGNVGPGGTAIGSETAGASPDTTGGERAEERFLHARASDRVEAGGTLAVRARIGRTGSEARSQALRRFEIPAEGAPVALIAHAPAFTHRTPERQIVTVYPGRDSDWVMFELAAGAPGTAQISIEAWRAGTLLGELTFAVTIGVERAAARTRDIMATVSSERQAGEVSLVIRFDADLNRYRFEFRDEDFPPEQLSEGLLEPPWVRIRALIEKLEALAGGSGRSAQRVRDELAAEGQRLWRDLVPEPMREQFWERRERIRQLTIVSDSDPVPWELLYPLKKGKPEGFLVELFPIVRAKFRHRRPQTLRGSPARYVLPPGSPVNALAELREVSRLLNDDHPTILNAREDLQHVLDQGGFGLLHFACHNTVEDDFGMGPWIDFGPEDRFALTDLERARILKPLEETAPLVFLNACGTAGQVALYVHLDGWAQAFLEAGAGAFVGSLWSVRDATARRFAEGFYRAMAVEGLPFAQAVYRARLEIGQEAGDPTWLAYAAYGHPMARFAGAQGDGAVSLDS
jgi:CHAT domain-containing protein/tetratricopeptide (TPR) repeat protein